MSRGRNLLPILLLLALAQAAHGACVTPFFHEETSAGTFDRHVVGDLNNDGFPDIVTPGGDGVVVLAGNGTDLRVRGRSTCSAPLPPRSLDSRSG